MRFLLLILSLTATSAFANTVLKPGESVFASGCEIVVDTDGAILIIPTDSKTLLTLHGPRNGKDEYMMIRIPRPSSKCTAALDSKELENVRGSLLERFKTAEASEQDSIRKALLKVNTSLFTQPASASSAAEAIGAG